MLFSQLKIEMAATKILAVAFITDILFPKDFLYMHFLYLILEWHYLTHGPYSFYHSMNANAYMNHWLENVLCFFLNES